MKTDFIKSKMRIKNLTSHYTNGTRLGVIFRGARDPPKQTLKNYSFSVGSPMIITKQLTRGPKHPILLKCCISSNHRSKSNLCQIVVVLAFVYTFTCLTQGIYRLPRSQCTYLISLGLPECNWHTFVLTFNFVGPFRVVFILPKGLIKSVGLWAKLS